MKKETQARRHNSGAAVKTQTENAGVKNQPERFHLVRFSVPKEMAEAIDKATAMLGMDRDEFICMAVREQITRDEMATQKPDFGAFMALETSIAKTKALLVMFAEQAQSLQENLNYPGAGIVASGINNLLDEARTSLDRDFKAAAEAFRQAKGGAR